MEYNDHHITTNYHIVWKFFNICIVTVNAEYDGEFLPQHRVMKIYFHVHTDGKLCFLQRTQ